VSSIVLPPGRGPSQTQAPKSFTEEAAQLERLLAHPVLGRAVLLPKCEEAEGKDKRKDDSLDCPPSHQSRAEELSGRIDASGVSR